jgi:hypothetical protein
MIYINNNASTIVRTESWLSYIPEKVFIKIDEIEVGEFMNISLSPTYITFEITKDLIESLNLENMEYTMKIYKDYSLFKTELISVESNRIIEFTEKQKEIIIKMKEVNE